MFKEMKVITDTNQIDRKKWREFINTHPHGNILQTPEMYEVYKKTKNYEPICIAAIENDEIVAILLAVIQKDYEGILGSFTARSIIFGGPIINSDHPILLDLLIKKYLNLVKNKAIYTQIRNFTEQNTNDKNVFIKNSFEFENHLNILVSLSKSEEQLWNELHSKRRNIIRRAKKEGVVLNLQNDEISLRQSYEILKEVYTRAKLPLPKYDLIKNLLGVEDAEFKLLNFTAVYEQKIIGCMLILAYKKVLYDFFAGSFQAYYKKYPNDLIPWEIFIWGKLNGYELFDFGGAGKPNVPYGVREYKLKFGGELVNFGRYTFVHKPLMFILGKVALKLWQKLWQKLR